MKKLILSTILAASALLGGQNMLTTATNDLSVDETVVKLTNILKEKGMTLFDIIHHSKLAKDVGLDMTDTSVVIYGAPKAGTPLMQCAPQIALELPLKFLIYKNEGKTTVAYEDIKSIAQRHNASECAPVAKISEVQANLFKAITK